MDDQAGWHAKQRRTNTPSVVKQVIENALKKGWDPFHATGEIRMKCEELGFPDATDAFPALGND